MSIHRRQCGAIRPDLLILIGVNDAPMLSDPDANMRHGGVAVISPRPIDCWPSPIRWTSPDRILVYDIPGCPGHIVYVLKSESPNVVLGGDVLFRGGIGRCDLPGGDQDLLVRGIREKLFSLPEDTIVYPGHGNSTTVGREKRTNPFCAIR